MKVRTFSALWLLPVISAAFTAGETRGQVQGSLPNPNPSIPLELPPLPAPAGSRTVPDGQTHASPETINSAQVVIQVEPQGPATYPTPQGLKRWTCAEVANLPNPFEWGPSLEKSRGHDHGPPGTPYPASPQTFYPSVPGPAGGGAAGAVPGASAMPGVPGTPGAVEPGVATTTAAGTNPGQAYAEVAAGGPGFGGGLSAGSGNFPMIGDHIAPLSSIRASALVGPPGLPGGRGGPPQPPPPGARSQLAPSVRGFKMADNQSPIPQDRVFFGFNSFANLNAKLDKDFEAPIKGLNVYRYVWGFEKTFNNGLGSVGMQLPLDNVYAQSRVKTLNEGGNATSAGNLTVFLKHVFYVDAGTGNLASGGVALTPETGPSRFGGAKFLRPSNTTSIQPFFAFYLNFDRFYVLGFSALDVPIDNSQALMYFNDLSVGYFLLRNYDSNRLITAIAPTAEVHVNTPLNHTNPYRTSDYNGVPDIVDVTGGVNIGLRQRSILTFGVVAPVTGPRPFDLEATVLLNYYFGRTARRPPSPPMIGG